MRRETHFSNSPTTRGDDAISDSGWRDRGDRAGQWWWQRVQRVHVQRTVRDDE